MTSIIKQLEEKKDSLNIEFYKPVNEEIVDRFEKEYITLPTEYLDFIRKSDGLGATEVFDGMIYSLKDTKDVLEPSIKCIPLIWIRGCFTLDASGKILFL